MKSRSRDGLAAKGLLAMRARNLVWNKVRIPVYTTIFLFLTRGYAKRGNKLLESF